ncbi:MAG: hypothetical protein VW268_13325 [Rhodospirillaceae bacterium]
MRPAVVIRTMADAVAAARRAERLGVEVCLLSAPGAAAALGPAVFIEIVNQTRAQVPAADIVGCLDCGGDAGTALNAVRLGIDIIRLDAPEPAWSKVHEIAQAAGLALIAERPDDIDPAAAGADAVSDVSKNHT